MNFEDIFKSSFLENVTSVSLLDMALALILAFGIGLFIFFVYKKTYSGVMYSAYKDGYVSFEYSKKDASFRVLDVCEDKDALEPFLQVRLPKIISAEVGKRIVFESSSFEVSYVKSLIDALENKQILPRVASVDVKDISMLSYTMKTGCCIKLGTMNDLEKKLDEAERQLALAENENATAVDVSNPQKPTVVS